MSYYEGPPTLRNKSNPYFAKENHRKLRKIDATKTYISTAEPIDPVSTFLVGDVGGFYLLNPSKMFQDSVGGTPVVNDGDPVGAIVDSSGLSNNLTGLNKPVYRTVTVGKNTYHGIEFDGVDDSLATGTLAFTSKNAGTAILGLEPTEFTGVNRTAMGMNLHLTGGWGFVIPSTNNSGYVNYRGVSNRTVRLDAGSTKYEQPYTATLAMRFDFASPQLNLYDNQFFLGQTLNDPEGTLVDNPLVVGVRNGTVWPYRGIIWGSIYFNARYMADTDFYGVQLYMSELVPPGPTGLPAQIDLNPPASVTQVYTLTVGQQNNRVGKTAQAGSINPSDLGNGWTITRMLGRTNNNRVRLRIDGYDGTYTGQLRLRYDIGGPDQADLLLDFDGGEEWETIDATFVSFLTANIGQTITFRLLAP